MNAVLFVSVTYYAVQYGKKLNETVSRYNDTQIADALLQPMEIMSEIEGLVGYSIIYMHIYRKFFSTFLQLCVVGRATSYDGCCTIFWSAW
jgi:hypothetical protein